MFSRRLKGNIANKSVKTDMSIGPYDLDVILEFQLHHVMHEVPSSPKLILLFQGLTSLIS